MSRHRGGEVAKKNFLSGIQRTCKAPGVVQSGSEAVNAFAKLSSMDSQEKEERRNLLPAHCAPDTLMKAKVPKKRQATLLR